LFFKEVLKRKKKREPSENLLPCYQGEEERGAFFRGGGEDPNSGLNGEGHCPSLGLLGRGEKKSSVALGEEGGERPPRGGKKKGEDPRPLSGKGRKEIALRKRG